MGFSKSRLSTFQRATLDAFFDRERGDVPVPELRRYVADLIVRLPAAAAPT